MKTVYLFTTGGTISSQQSKNGLVPSEKSDGEAMLELLPNIRKKCNVVSESLMNIDSSNITVSDILLIADKINNVIGKADGVVITHGTDTMSYTAALLYEILENPSVPVVITGAQKPFDAENSDGLLNLNDSFITALSGYSAVCVCFGGKIIRGNTAYKMFSKDESAFISRDMKSLGTVKNGSLSFSAPAVRGKYNYNSVIEPNVKLIKITPTVTAEDIDYFGKNAKGLVIEAYGLGGVPSVLHDKIGELAAKKPVVIVSQCLYEGIDMNVYGIGTELITQGVISGGELTAEAAMARLQLCLGKTQNPAELKAIF